MTVGQLNVILSEFGTVTSVRLDHRPAADPLFDDFSWEAGCQITKPNGDSYRPTVWGASAQAAAEQLIGACRMWSTVGLPDIA